MTCKFQLPGRIYSDVGFEWTVMWKWYWILKCCLLYLIFIWIFPKLLFLLLIKGTRYWNINGYLDTEDCFHIVTTYILLKFYTTFLQHTVTDIQGFHESIPVFQIYIFRYKNRTNNNVHFVFWAYYFDICSICRWVYIKPVIHLLPCAV